MPDENIEALCAAVAQVEIQLQRGNWDAAHHAINRYRADIEHKTRELSYREKLQMPLAETGLDYRTVERLEGAGVMYVSQLVKLTPHHIFAIDSCGPATLERIVACLAELGMTLKGMEAKE